MCLIKWCYGEAEATYIGGWLPHRLWAESHTGLEKKWQSRENKTKTTHTVQTVIAVKSHGHNAYTTCTRFFLTPSSFTYFFSCEVHLFFVFQNVFFLHMTNLFSHIRACVFIPHIIWSTFIFFMLITYHM